MTRKFCLLFFAAFSLFFVLKADNPAWFQKKFPDFLISANRKKVNTASALKGKYVAVYFSASWCGPCRGFTPNLVKFYKQTAKKENIEIVFCSRDKNAKEMAAYMRKDSMPWLAIPYNSPIRKKFGSEMKVNGIPTLVVFDNKGKIVSTNARWDVVLLGAKAAKAWKSPEYKPLTYEDYKKKENKTSPRKTNNKRKKVRKK